MIAEHARRVGWRDRELSLLQTIHERFHLRHHSVGHVAQAKKQQRLAQVLHLGCSKQKQRGRAFAVSNRGQRTTNIGERALETHLTKL